MHPKASANARAAAGTPLQRVHRRHYLGHLTVLSDGLLSWSCLDGASRCNASEPQEACAHCGQSFCGRYLSTVLVTESVSDNLAQAPATGPLASAAIAVRVATRDFSEPSLTSRRVAAALGVSHAHLCRLVRQTTGTTFSALLRAIRTREAAILLTSTSLSVKEVAALTGFSSTAPLDRAFRRAFGESPTEYRMRSAVAPD